MNVHVVVVRPFGGLSRGDIVTDSVRVTQILSSPHARDVVRVATPVQKGA
jgi:hypothetical protein